MDCDYSMIAMLTSTLKSLHHLKTVDGSNLSGLDDYVAELASKGIKLKQQQKFGIEYFRKSVNAPYLNKLIQNVTNRFEDKSLMCAIKIFDPTTLPVEPADLQQHGIDDVKRLATHYGPTEILATPEECLSKWGSFKQFVKERGVNSHADMIQLLDSITLYQL